MRSDVVKDLAREIEEVDVSAEEADVVALYALVLGLGSVTVLDGTTNADRMRFDLHGLDVVGRWAENHGKEKWERHLARFKRLIGERG